MTLSWQNIFINNATKFPITKLKEMHVNYVSNKVYTNQGAGGTAKCVHIHEEWSQDALPASGVAPRPFDAAPWFDTEW